MFPSFLERLRKAGISVSITEYLSLLGAMRAEIADYSIEDFYFLTRACLVKDERQLDRFDRVFGECFRGVAAPSGELQRELPEAWLRMLAERFFSTDEMAKIEAAGGFAALMEALRQRLAEQQERHEGGSKWIGTLGTSPFGAGGYNPAGVRIGAVQGRHGRALKLWDQRSFRDLDDQRELGTRTLKLALRRLRRFARQGAASVLDINDTVRATAGNAGLLDLRMVPERHNTVKLLLLLDIGGSMDPHVRVCEEIFSAARSEFKHLEHFYFHNCPYERLWQSNRRRHDENIPTETVMRRYGQDYRLILIGDAAMSPYELTEIGGSVEHYNAEPGSLWLQRLTAHFRRHAWINPVPQSAWSHSRSCALVRALVGQQMYPMTLQGIDQLTRTLIH